MPISDFFGLLSKRQTTPDKFLASSVNIVAGGQQGALRAPFSQDRGVRAYRSWGYAAATINANAVAAKRHWKAIHQSSMYVPHRTVRRRRYRAMASIRDWKIAGAALEPNDSAAYT